jgi:hypothetical protein
VECSIKALTAIKTVRRMTAQEAINHKQRNEAMTTATSDRLPTKNKRTGKREFIEQHELEMVDWGFHFFVDGEMEAFKAAYQYKDAPHGVKVEFAGGVQRWMVTVFNATAADAGIDGAK